MPQLSLYLDVPTMESLRHASEKAGVSLSKYAGQLIRDHAGAGWPAGFWGTYGALDDETFTAPEELSFSLDAPRKEL